MRASALARAGRVVALVAAMAPALSFADILLGHSGDLSGNSAALTKDYLRGMNAYFDAVNKKGGIRGEKIKLVSMDDGFNPDRTVQNVKALIEQDALALVGVRGTANLQKIIPLIQQAGIPQIGNTAGAKSLREPVVEGMFHLRASTTDEIEAAVNHAWTIGIKRIAAGYQDDPFGKEALDALNAALKKRSAEPVAVAPVPRGTEDVAKAVQAISAVEPQAVFYLGQAKPAAALIRGLTAKGIHAQYFILSVASGIHAELKEKAAGVIVSQVSPYPYRELGTPVVREYQKTLGEKDDGAYSFNSMEGYLNAKLVVAALQKTPPPLTRAKLMATMKGLHEDLGGFTINFDKGSNQGSHFVVLTMVRKDGTFAR